MINMNPKEEAPGTYKPSPLFLFLVLAICGVVWLFKPRFGSFHDTHLMKAYSDVNGGLKTVLEMFSNDCGRLSTTAEGFQALLTCPTNLPRQGKWQGPSLEPSDVKDPWGHEYVYRCPGIHNPNSYDLYSKGSDGIDNDSDDIGNWR
jgi:general secretion pathway protein G